MWQLILYKLALNLTLSIGGIMMFAALVQGFNSTDEERKKKPIPPYRLIRNIKYSLESLLVLPVIFEMIQSPFASMNILHNIFMDPFGNWRIAAGKFPAPTQITSIEEVFKGMDQVRKDRKEKAKETSEEKKLENLTINQ